MAGYWSKVLMQETSTPPRPAKIAVLISSGALEGDFAPVGDFKQSGMLFFLTV